MPEPADWDEVETADSGWSRRALLFGAKGESPGTFYDVDTATKETPNPSCVITRTPH
jgi:hypothetical protein